MFILKGASIALAAFSVATVTNSAVAQFVQEHVVAVESSTPASAKDFLQGNKGPSVQLAGKLLLAKAGEKQPVVVILPGAGGIGASRHSANEWARVLNDAGIHVHSRQLHWSQEIRDRRACGFAPDCAGG